jgi:plastocyanin
MRIRVMLCGLAIALPALALTAALAAAPASGPSMRGHAAAQPISVVIDGKLQHYAIPPRLTAGHIIVPMREVFESLGASVAWDAETKQVRAMRGQTEIILTVGDRGALVDGKPVQLETAPAVARGAVFVPLRFISEALGANVTWQARARRIMIASAPAPPAAEPAMTAVPPSAPGTATASSPAPPAQPEEATGAPPSSGPDRPPAVETAAATPGSGAQAARSTQRVSAALLDYDIRLQPSEVFAGAIKFYVRNLGPAPHALAIDGMKDRTKVLKVGEHTTLQVTFKPGNYTLYCPVDFHRALGTKTRLRVK